LTRTVLYVHSSAGRYGADRQLAAIAGGLDPDRYRAVAVLAEDGPLVEDLRAAGVETIVRTELSVLRRALFSPAGLARVGRRLAADRSALGRLARERGAALVHANTSVTVGAYAAAAGARVPLAVSVREIYVDFARWWPLYRRFLLRADALLCSSEPVREQFAGDPRARVLHEAVTGVARRAPRDAARAALDLPDDAFVVAVLGRLSSWKGQEVLIEALADPTLAEAAGQGEGPPEEAGLGEGLPEEAGLGEGLAGHGGGGPALALIAGDAWPGEERHAERLRDLSARLGVADRVRMVGFREDVENVYGAADVVVVPSTRPDPLPNSALESAAAGCCVVAAAHGGLPEILCDGETGRLVAPGDARALASVLAELRADPAARERLGAAAAADVADRFSVALLLERTQALYDQLLER
jgi:glycosyltransferase involved in cell wall biosynthesis